MNRTEFMNQLEILLQNISFAEKEEALQYYNDYFDDAGAENEQNVIEALGNPARVAENIRRELLENQGVGSSTAADRAVVEYGKTDIEEPAGELSSSVSAGGHAGELPPVSAGGHAGELPSVSADGHAGELSSSVSAGGHVGEMSEAYGFGKNMDTAGCGNSRAGRAGRAGGPERSSGAGGSGSGGNAGVGGNPGSGGRPGMSGGMIALIAVLAVFASPFIVGLLCIMFGLLMMWLALILGFGIVVLSMFIVLLVLLIVGGMCIPVDPLVGFALIGGGLVCGGVGILFLMLTVAMAGIVTPAIFRGIGHIFRFGRKEAAAA